MSAEIVDMDSRRRVTGPAHVDPDIERALCGCVALDNAAIDEAIDLVAPADFGTLSGRHTWEAMLALHKRGEPIDLLTLRGELDTGGRLERVGEAYVLAISEWLPSPHGAEHYARRIRQLAGVRKIVAACREVELRASRPIDDLAGFVADAEARVASAARERAEARGPVALKDAVVEVFEGMTAAADAVSRGEQPDGAIGTRFTALDARLGGGFRPGNLIIIAGRPGMGKTAIALDLALSMQRSPGIVFSLEMSRDELARRALASEARVDGGRIRTASLAREDWTRLTSAAGSLTNLGVHIDDTPGATLSHIRATSRRMKAREGLAWIVVDYLQLMRSDERGIGREEQIGGISRGLKMLAGEFEIPVVALAQLNRELEKRPITNRRPQLSDLRDSGAIEQDADVVAFVYREEMYQRDNPDVKGLAELIIGKQRSGPTGTIGMRYLAEYTRFEEHAKPSAWQSMPDGVYDPDPRIPDDDWSDD
jgi:replicative DNA helicase